MCYSTFKGGSRMRSRRAILLCITAAITDITLCGPSLAKPGVTESILVPAPIAESEGGASSWAGSDSPAILIHDGNLTGEYAVDSHKNHAPLPDGITFDSPEEPSTASSAWPSWHGPNVFCDACGTHDCQCGKLNHGLVGNLVDRHRGSWAVRFDTLILWRNAPQSRPLFTSGGTTSLNADQLESNALAAPRISLMHMNECGYGTEFTYLYAGNFYGEQSRAVDDYAPPGIYGITSPSPTEATATLLGRLQSFEANSRTPIAAGNVQFISGFRWIQWQEELRIAATATAPPTANYLTNCFNDLYGGQIGFDTLLYQSNRGFRLEGLVKAGAYYNQAVQHSSTNAASVASEGSPASGAFAGEVGLTSVVPITKNWNFWGGYFGLWLESIAQPSRQLSGQNLSGGANSTSLSTIGNVVIQGVSLGVEGHW